jgi:signal recognition particle receptor subunit beta
MLEKKCISIALIGDSEVGKTEIVRLIDKNVKSTGTTYRFDTENILYTIWELRTKSSEPEKLEIFSTSFLENSEPYNRFVLIITDSSQEDVNKIKYSIKFLRQTFPKTRLAIIANKQDLKNRISGKQIEKMTKLPTLNLSTMDPTQRERLLNFISYLIETDTGL